MYVRNITRNTMLAENCSTARTFWSRFRGLQLKKELSPYSGLLIMPCNSIHMFFMRFSIDAIFIDENNTVLHIEEGIKPWRVSKIIRKARSVLEIPAGTVSSSRTATGDMLEFGKQ